MVDTRLALLMRLLFWVVPPAVSDSGDPDPEPEPTPKPEEELVWRLVSFRYRIDKDIHVGRMIRRLREKQDRLEEKFDEAHAKL
ncbi:hypothetical protein N7470_006536 [Penicillium chermesinum]|nr:hypothetical protein N7470_006536 [Penicillium chermesinum]